MPARSAPASRRLCSRFDDLGVDGDEALLSDSVHAAFARIADALGGRVFAGPDITAA